MNAPSTDTWSMAPLFEKAFSSKMNLTVGDLWAQHLEHRPLLPRIFLLLMGPLTQFNIVTILYATQLCLLAAFVCVFLAYRDTVGRDNKSLFLAVPVSLLMFSFGQYFNLLHAWSIHVVVVNFFGILSFLLLTKLRDKGQRTAILLFVASTLCASAATLSAGHGLLVWPAGLMQLYLESIPSRRKRYLSIIWVMTGIVHWTVYFWDFDVPAGGMSERYFFNDSLLGVNYFLGLIGSALSTRSNLAILIGFVVGATFTLVIFYIIKSREQVSYTFWISLSAFSILTLAAATAGRSGQEISGTMPSKYVTFSVLLTISVYIMMLRLARDHGWSRTFAPPAGICAVLIILSAPLSYYSGVQYGQAFRTEMEQEAFTLIHYENRTNKELAQALRPDLAAKHSWIRREIRHYAAVFDNLNYTVFSESASAIRHVDRKRER